MVVPNGKFRDFFGRFCGGGSSRGGDFSGDAAGDSDDMVLLMLAGMTMW